MANARLTHEYQKNAVNGASPLQLVIMLYDGAIRFMETGKKAIAARDLELQNRSLQKAQKIVMELMSCLDMQQGGEVAKNLLSLYSYVLNELVMANMSGDVPSIDRSIRVLGDLRESWRSIHESTRGGESGQEQLAA